MTSLIRLIATGCGSGFLPMAPGTWASLIAVGIGVLVAWQAGAWGLLILAVISSVLGVWASEHYEQLTGSHDPSEVVIDEWAGQWLALGLALLFVPASLWLYLIGFFAFRLFDITKVFPANWAQDHFQGGLGIMVDDLIAGVYAAIITVLLIKLIF